MPSSVRSDRLRPPLLTMRGIRKTFPGVVALDDVDLVVEAGTVHALMGENGAGKSTLMKVLIGLHAPDAGEILLAGEPVTIPDTRTGLDLGVAMIHQELAPVPEMTVAENLFLGREPRGRFGLVDRRRMRADATRLLADWGIALDADAQLKHLSVAQQQMVEIAKAISHDARVVVMDEPTSALTEREVDLLHAMIRRLTATGVAVVYITHKMAEVFAISDTITVFRDGRHIATRPAADLDGDELIRLMVGRELTQLYPDSHATIGDIALEVRGLTGGPLVRDVSLAVRRGEILGIAGLMGAGRTEVLETIFGMRPYSSGEVLVGGVPVRITAPSDAIAHGLALLTEDRKADGVMGVLSVRDNMLAAALPRYTPRGFLRVREARAAAEAQRRALRVKTPDLDTPMGTLSGGNQQKALLARWLLTAPDVLMIDEPTRGIDVGAKSEIHRLMSELAAQGKAIVMVSSELPEILGMSDRIVVMSEGRVTGELTRAEATQEAILRLATPDLPVAV